MGTINNIGLVGWNGKKNIGDDAMTAVIINYILKKNKLANFLLLADDKNLACYNRNYSKNIKGFKGYNLLHRLPILRRILRHPLYIRKFIDFSDIILIGGGSIFHNSHSSNWHHRIAATQKKQDANSTVGAIGVSLGPFGTHSDFLACKGAVETLDFITVRDEQSYAILQEMHVSTPTQKALDLALLYPQLVMGKTAAPPVTKEKLTIGIALRHDKLSPKNFGLIVDCLDRLLQEHPNLRIRIFEFCADGKAGDIDTITKLCRSIADKQNIEVVHYSPETSSFYDKIQSCHIMIAMRLHAAVLAYASQTPFIVLAYAEKCHAFAKEIGLDSDLIFDIQSFDEQKFTAVIEKSFEQNFDIAATHSLPIQKATEAAAENFKFLTQKLSADQ